MLGAFGQAALATRPAVELLERARCLGLAVALEQAPMPAPWCQVVAGEPWHAAPNERARPPRVVDLSSLWAGPLCTHVLAMLGAEVLHIESTARPDGTRLLSGLRFSEPDWWEQSGIFSGLNTNKKSVTLNLKHPEAVGLVKRLVVEWADAIAENYAPRMMRKFGLDYESVKKSNPNVVYCWITGFGSKGPRNDQPATDSVMQAYTGMMSINRGPTGIPQRIEMLAIDFSTGLYAFQAVSAALYKKARKGLGAYIETSLRECALALQEGAMMESFLQGGNPEPIGRIDLMFSHIDQNMAGHAFPEHNFVFGESFKTLLRMSGISV